jgi:hypothetical protein
MVASLSIATGCWRGVVLTCWKMLLRCSRRRDSGGGMIQISDTERRRAFSVWLRTGRWPTATIANDVEVKFNPRHDPADGRFTFAGSGRAYGAGGISGSSSGARPRGSTARPTSPLQSRTPEHPKSLRTVAVPSSSNAMPRARPISPKAATPIPVSHNGGGGSFGGAGATSTEPWRDGSQNQRSASKAAGTATRPMLMPTAAPGQRPGVAAAPPPLRLEVRNGYEYQIDETARTRKVSGNLKLADTQVRSRTAQAQAGGADRRATDDGGHYIAARFAGPTDAFNHFAQDTNFNRGQYRLLEDQWAKATRAGRKVTVKIAPSYDRASKRPAVINIWFTINGHEQSQQIPNEPREKRRGK